jgi:hypothetical protein
MKAGVDYVGDGFPVPLFLLVTLAGLNLGCRGEGMRFVLS